MTPLKERLSKTACATHWEKIGIFPHHGINVPLSALHSEKSSGIGEFYDLFILIDWCSALKLDVIQLLPLNDSGDDPSPYYSVSSCALNPLFLSLHGLPYLDKTPQLQEKLQNIQKLNVTKTVVYHDVQSSKLLWLNEYFLAVGSSITNTKPYEEFIAKNHLWLESYALFKAIKKMVSKNHWMSWPKELQKPSANDYALLLKQHAQEISFHFFLQYLCFTQLKEVKKYANDHHVFLFGDIPILISSDSADVWQHQEQFDLKLEAGAPPDMYSLEGQVWGFPIFNWEYIKQNHFFWWKQRLIYASEFYDLYRIDHVVGFFRIWAVPLNEPSSKGHFYPTDESLWIPNGEERLKMMIETTPMLPIAEDLGTVSLDVREVLLRMGICGTKVMRWERKWNEDKSFISIKEYPPISLTTVSTHDSETLQLWWRNSPEEAKDFAAFKHWDYAPELSLAQRREILWDSHHTSSLFHVNLLQEYLAFFSDLVWPKPEDERINIPGQVLPSNWNYRFRPNLETLLKYEPLKKEISTIVFS